METAIAIWGAVVATVLAIREILIWRRDRPLLDVSGSVISVALPSTSDDRDSRFVIVTDHRGIEQGLFLGLGVANRGRRATQVVSAVFSDGKSEQQVAARQLPAVLEPNSRIDLVLQLEWISTHGANLVVCGVLDALGRRHHIPSAALRDLVEAVSGLPTRAQRYRRMEGADPRFDERVTAFQAFDPCVLVHLEPGRVRRQRDGEPRPAYAAARCRGV